ncbi:1,4-dihydroxy-2-naphthoate octaprenyltransferase [Clostridium sp. WILCCON 0269]|uniref:1,4-dihydroxy-2-naphthoate octaprenyltransferase n=1 Tax=Candidatus Clostridium eludens TaxID=3381663 RepID=A0ABW8SFK5_9CLOT
MLVTKLKIWFKAVRPFSFTGSIIPVTLGAIFAINESKFQLGYFVLSLIAIVLLQASANLLSDHDDFKNRVDTKNSYGSSGVILENLLASKKVYTGGFILLALGAFIGIFLSYKRGLLVLLIGLIGTLAVYSYTGKPLSLKYRGLGAPLVFLTFGPLMLIGSYYVQAQNISVEAFFISIPVGLLTTAILHANDIRDIRYDKKAGIKTLSIMVGRSSAQNIYFSFIILSYVSIIIMCFYRILPIWSLFCLITVPTAYKNIRKLYSVSASPSGIVSLDKDTAQLQGEFGIILILSLLIPFVVNLRG